MKRTFIDSIVYDSDVYNRIENTVGKKSIYKIWDLVLPRSSVFYRNSGHEHLFTENKYLIL